MSDLRPCPFCGGAAAVIRELNADTLRVSHTDDCFARTAHIRCSTASKVLFLDIDGVLNSTERAKAGIPYSTLMPDALAFLRHLVNHGIRIVVSSTWRRWRSTQQLSDILAVPVADITPISRFNATRGAEIQAWLDANGSPDYCIIDDDNDMLPEQRPRFVRTTCESGMQPWHMDEVCRVLSLPSNTTLDRSNPPKQTIDGAGPQQHGGER